MVGRQRNISHKVIHNAKSFKKLTPTLRKGVENKNIAYDCKVAGERGMCVHVCMCVIFKSRLAHTITFLPHREE